MNGFFKKLALLLFIVPVSRGFALPAHGPLVTYEAGRGFRLDENFKDHHRGLLECIDFLYKSDIGRHFVDEALKQKLLPASEASIGSLSLEECKEATVLAEHAAGALQERYKLTLLDGITGDAENARDFSTCFAYHEATNTLIMAFCGMDEALDKENVVDSELVRYPDTSEADNILVHRGLLERSYKEFTDIVWPEFFKFWNDPVTKTKRSGMKIIITGHSLGGGRALLHATFLAERLQVVWLKGTCYTQANQIKVYNLGGLLPGNANFVRYMEELIGGNNILTQATAFDKGPALQPGPGGYTAGVTGFLGRYHNALCPIPGWYAYDYARDVWNRNYEQRYEAWQKRWEKHSDDECRNPKNWYKLWTDRHKSFTRGPLHYLASMNEFYGNWFDPAIIGGYQNPVEIEQKLLPQGVRAQETYA